jgi:hypothetical protein
MRLTSGAFVRLAFLSVLLASCASLPAPSVWKEEAYLGGPVKKIFVIGAFTEGGIRKLVEKEFILRLASQGTEAIASHTVLSTAAVEKYDAVLSIMKEQGCDAVILVRSPGKSRSGRPLLRTETDGAARRTLSDQWQEYYLQGYPAMPAYTWQKEHYGVETDLFEAVTGRSIWKATFDITVQGPVVQDVIPLVGIMVKQLRADGMIR